MALNIRTPHIHEHLMHPKYRPDIDGLRAIAILSVVGFHAFPNLVKGGFIGVDVFFVISGFLISTILIGSLERNSFSFIDFYIRRINRIFPALLLVLISCFAFGWFSLLADEYKQLGKHISGGAGFISNFLLWNESGYFDKLAEAKPLLHLWSLGVEEQFYIVWPLLIWLAWKQSLNLLAIAVLVGIISFAFNIGNVEDNAPATFYSPQTRFWELMAGSVLAYMIQHKQDIFPKLRHALDVQFGKIIYAQPPEANGNTLRNVQSVFGAALIAIGILVTSKEDHFPGWWALLPIFGAVLIISGGKQAWLNRAILSNRILVWFGLISFPLYLWHWPLLSFAYILQSETPSREIRIGAVLLSIVLAWLTYRLIESPLRFGKHSRLKAVTLLILMILVGYAGYNDYIHDGFKQRRVVLNNIDPAQQVAMRSNPPSSCIDETKYPLAGRFCIKYADESSKKTIVLWGDSSTGAWQPVFLDIAKSNHYTIVNISIPSCPPILAARKTKFNWPASRTYCADGKTQAQVIELIKEMKPTLTVVIAAWNSYSPYTNREYLTDKNDEEADSTTTKRTLAKHVPETIEELEKISKLIVFRSWPMLPSPPNYEISRIPELQKKESDRTVADANEFNKDNEFINAIFDRIDSSNIVFFDPSKKICSEQCVSIINRTRMYDDGYHISPHGSMQFKSEIENLLM